MRKVILLAITACFVAMLLAFAIGSASASRSLQIVGETTLSLNGVVTFASENEITCQLTITRTMSRVIPKIVGTLKGKITAIAAGRPGEARCRSTMGELRDIRFLGLEREEQARLFYQGFTGTLPRITTILLAIKFWRVSFTTTVTGFTITCLYESEGNVESRIAVTSGVLGIETLGENRWRRVEGSILCPATVTIRGTLTPLQNISIRLLSKVLQCPGTRLTIDGVGSSLQGAAQERAWRSEYATDCTDEGVRYESLGSGQGLREWGFEAFRAAEIVSASGTEFVGTDEAPEPREVRHAEENANRQGVTLIPVAQAAIAIIANPPAECTVTQISSRNLDLASKGRLRWEAIGTGAGCREKRVQRVVRLDASGTTFQYKHYLWLILGEEVEGARNWLNYQEPAANTSWPTGERAAIAAGRRGGSALVREVRERPETIGYAALSDVVLNGAEARRLRVENNTGTERFADPRSGNESNCANSVYRENLGLGAEIGRGELATEWFKIYGSNPRIGERTAGAYPICTLTWDVVLLDYRAARFAAGTGEAVKAYIGFIVLREGGQAVLEEKQYGRLPETIREGAEGTVARITRD